MKKGIYLKTLVIIMGYAVNSCAQERVGQKQAVLVEMQKQRQEQNFYRKTLQVDSTKAVQVSQVQNNYKADLKLLIADTSLNEADRRVKIQALMDNKNRKLREILTPIQQEKIIPTTERMPAGSDKKF